MPRAFLGFLPVPVLHYTLTVVSQIKPRVFPLGDAGAAKARGLKGQRI